MCMCPCGLIVDHQIKIVIIKREKRLKFNDQTTFFFFFSNLASVYVYMHLNSWMIDDQVAYIFFHPSWRCFISVCFNKQLLKMSMCMMWWEGKGWNKEISQFQGLQRLHDIGIGWLSLQIFHYYMPQGSI